MVRKILNFKRVIKRKNAQIRAEREKLNAAEVANNIFASYILCLAADSGEVRLSRSKIAETVGKYRAEVSATEDEYVIRVREINPDKAMSAEEKRKMRSNACYHNAGGCSGAWAEETIAEIAGKDEGDSRAEGGEGVEKD